MVPRPLAATCTGVSATWCPVHGDCTCRIIHPDGERSLTSPDCPLHAYDSPHPIRGRVWTAEGREFSESDRDMWLVIDPRYEITLTHRLVRILPPELWWERLWLDLKWRLRRR